MGRGVEDTMVYKGSTWQTVTAQIVGIGDMEKPLTGDDIIWSWGSEKEFF